MRTITLSLRVVGRALFLMPRLFLATFACLLAANLLIRLAFPPHFAAHLVTGGSGLTHYAPPGIETVWQRPALDWLGGIVKGFIAAPLIVSIHRYVLIGECRDRWPVPRYARDFRLALWWAVLRALFPLLHLVDNVKELAGEPVSAIVEIAVLVVPAVVLGRLLVLLPAIALDRHHAVRLSLELTRGYLLKIVFLVIGLILADLLLIIIPYSLIWFTIHRVAAAGLVSLTQTLSLTRLVTMTSLELLFVTTMAVLASRLLQMFTAEAAAT